MWIAIAIILAVYLVLSTFEAVRNFVVISPVNIHSRQTATIGSLAEENENLKRQFAVPEVSAQEKRRRIFVSGELKKLGEAERKILRYIHDQGHVDAMTLRVNPQFNAQAVSNAIGVTHASGLISYVSHVVSIKAEFQPAVEFVFSSEYNQELSG
jgi:hypothetical protein